MHMPIIFTTDDGEYNVESHGNGWAYTVTHNPSGDTLWFQDSDADQLRRDTGDFHPVTTSYILGEYFSCLS